MHVRRDTAGGGYMKWTAGSCWDPTTEKGARQINRMMKIVICRRARTTTEPTATKGQDGDGNGAIQQGLNRVPSEVRWADT